MHKEYKIFRSILDSDKSNEGRTQPTSVEQVLQLEQKQPFRSQLEAFEAKKRKPFEAIPFAEKEKFLLTRLDGLTGLAKVNPLWKQRLEAAGVGKINSWDDWQRV